MGGGGRRPRHAAWGPGRPAAGSGSAGPRWAPAARARAPRAGPSSPRGRPESRRASGSGTQLGASWGRGARRPHLSRAKGSGRAGSPTRASGDHRGGRLAGLGTEILTKECRPESRERAPTPARAPAGYKLHTHACLCERFPRAERWACKAGRAARSRVGAHGGARARGRRCSASRAGPEPARPNRGRPNTHTHTHTHCFFQRRMFLCVSRATNVKRYCWGIHQNV